MTLPPSIDTVNVTALYESAVTGTAMAGSVRFSLMAPRSYLDEDVILMAWESFELVNGELDVDVPKGEYVVSEQVKGGRRYLHDFQEDIVLSDIESIIVPPEYDVIEAIRGEPGPQGPAGPSGTGSYEHTQSAASADWVIEHALGYYPAVSILIDNSVVFADVTHNSTSQTTITFATPYTGKAVFS